MRVLFEVAPVDRDVLQRALDDDGFGDYEDTVAHAGVLPPPCGMTYHHTRRCFDEPGKDSHNLG